MTENRVDQDIVTDIFKDFRMRRLRWIIDGAKVGCGDDELPMELSREEEARTIIAALAT